MLSLALAKLSSHGKPSVAPPAQARKLRDEARSRLAAGEDPGEVKKEDKRQKQIIRETTFKKLAEAYKEKAEKEAKEKEEAKAAAEECVVKEEKPEKLSEVPPVSDEATLEQLDAFLSRSLTLDTPHVKMLLQLWISDYNECFPG